MLLTACTTFQSGKMSQETCLSPPHPEKIWLPEARYNSSQVPGRSWRIQRERRIPKAIYEVWVSSAICWMGSRTGYRARRIWSARYCTDSPSIPSLSEAQKRRHWRCLCDRGRQASRGCSEWGRLENRSLRLTFGVLYLRDTGLGGHCHHIREWDVLHHQAHFFRESILGNLHVLLVSIYQLMAPVFINERLN